MVAKRTAIIWFENLPFLHVHTGGRKGKQNKVDKHRQPSKLL